MMTKRFSKLIGLVLSVAVFFAAAIPVSADGGDDIWAQFIDDNGQLLTDNLIDQGVVTTQVDWMPSISIPGLPDIGGYAEYHVYEAPDGSVLQMPSATTLFFMALNPGVSGIADASSSLVTGAGLILSAPGILSMMLQGANIDFSGTDYTNPDQFADALIAGDTDIWSLPFGDVTSLLLTLVNNSIGDVNLYTAMLLYTPDNIPDEILDMLPEDFDFDDLPPLPPTCPVGFATPGKITRTGTLLAPNYPLVVGQDPDKRGVDLSFSVSVAPTKWTYYEQVPVIEEVCKALNGRPVGDSDCTRPNGNPGILKEDIVDWVCEERVQMYPETIPVAYASIALTSASRDWINNTLSIRYPGAYVHKGSFRWPSSSGGSSWSFERYGVQVQDPGTWSIIVAGRTSGTPVSDPRNFGGEAGTFQAWLKETAIVQ